MPVRVARCQHGHNDGLARFSSRELVDALLEASVVGSFTRIGYVARRRLFSWTPLALARHDRLWEFLAARLRGAT